MASLNLSVACESTQWGEGVAVVGSWSAWSQASATVLSTTASTFPNWTGTVILPVSVIAGSSLEYKYVILANGDIVRWEKGDNRSLTAPAAGASLTVDDGSFSGEKCSSGRRQSTKLKDARTEARAVPTASGYRFGDPPPPGVAPSTSPSHLPALELALVRVTGERRSWRERLAFIRALFAPEVDNDALAKEVQFDASDVSALAVVAAYLSFLSTGQIPCAEDGRHYRPNPHAESARAIAAALDVAATTGYAPFVARRVYPLLPSYAAQFTVSTPLTRIRDIAHRGDIPHELKQEIKHTLQNKLHRCAGPEDLVTCRNLLERVEHGGYSEAFVHELRRFYKELMQFFNATELDDQLRYIIAEHDVVRKEAVHLLRVKHEQAKPKEQLVALTDLRRAIARGKGMRINKAGDDASGVARKQAEVMQQVRLTDIELEGYAFPLLAALAGDAERIDPSCADLATHLSATLCPALALAFDNIALSGVRGPEAFAVAAELHAITAPKPTALTAQRARAAVDRARRFAAAFSAAIATLFGARIVALAAALGVEARAAAVFAESEIRANVAFQASRVADSAARVCRQVLNLPPWDPLLVGTAEGEVLYVEKLDDAADAARAAKGPVIVVARDAHGEEDIPATVRAVVLGRTMPHLSHLGVRARQANVVFVCAEDPATFDSIWHGQRLQWASVAVDTQKGLVHFGAAEPATASGGDGFAGSAAVRNAPKVTLEDLDLSGKHVLPMRATTAKNASAKAGFVARLARIAEESGGLFAVPKAAVVTHSAFQSALAEHKKEYLALVAKYDAAAAGEKAGESADAVREFIERELIVSEKVITQIQMELESVSRVMVRSSANAEDLEEMSGAGLYDSIANVDLKDATALHDAVRSVWGSLWTFRAAAGRYAAGVPHDAVSMAALVQHMAPATLSFVAFSRDPVTGASGTTETEAAVAVEVAVGMGETLASGGAPGTPYRFCVMRTSLEVKLVAFASFSDALVPAEDASVGLVARVVDYAKEAMTTDTAFREALVRRIARVVLRLEDEFGGPQDVEGAVNVEGGSTEVFVVQARPQIL